MRRKLQLENYRYPDRFGKWLGYKIGPVRRGHAESRLVIREDHLSPAGRLHGGVISALFDSTCGVAVFTTLRPKDFASTVEIKVNYFRPVDVGDRLRCVADVVFRGRRLCVLHARLYRVGERAVVGMCTATFNIVAGAEAAPLTRRKTGKR